MSRYRMRSSFASRSKRTSSIKGKASPGLLNKHMLLDTSLEREVDYLNEMLTFSSKSGYAYNIRDLALACGTMADLKNLRSEDWGYAFIKSCCKNGYVLKKEQSIFTAGHRPILSGFCASMNHKPDFMVYYDNLPITVIEIQSSTLKASLFQLYYDLIDVMRYLSHYYQNLEVIYGFLVPSLKRKGIAVSMKITCNIKYTVEVEGLQIKGDVKGKICGCIHEFTSMLLSLHRQNYEFENASFHLLPQRVINQLAIVCDKKNIVQMYSPHSMLFRNEDFVIKLPVEDNYAPLSLHYYVSDKPLKYSLTMDRMYYLEEIHVYSYRRLKPPYSLEVAKNNLSFIKGVIIALQELHESNVAHLDVRLENICFENEQPILIDLDRWKPANSNFSESYGSSCMYPQGEYKCSQVDYIQLGYLILYVLLDAPDTDYHSMSLETLEILQNTSSQCWYSLIRKLIIEGMNASV